MTKTWVDHLPDDAVREMLTEMLDAIETGTSLDPVVASWKATAEVYSDPELHKKLTTPSAED